MAAKNTETVKVVVRARPMNKIEFDNGSTEIVKIDQQYCQIIVESPDQNDKPRTFTFDMVYDGTSKQ